VLVVRESEALQPKVDGNGVPLCQGVGSESSQPRTQ
jgi:hypothetical protein